MKQLNWLKKICTSSWIIHVMKQTEKFRQKPCVESLGTTLFNGNLDIVANSGKRNSGIVIKKCRLHEKKEEAL